MLQVLESQDDVQFQNAVSNLVDIIDLAGCTALAARPANRTRLVDKLIHFYVIGRTADAIMQ